MPIVSPRAGALNHFDDAEFAGGDTLATADTFLGIHNGKPLLHTDGLLGASLKTDLTAKAANGASLFGGGALVLIGARHHSHLLFRYHLDNALRADGGAFATAHAEGG